MSDFVARQIDYIFFIAGFALMIAAGECVVLAEDKSERPGWLRLAGFLLCQGFALFGSASGPAFHSLAFRSYAAAVLNAASFAFLLAFALRDPGSSALRIVARLAPWALFGSCAAIGAVFDDRALGTAGSLLGAPSGILAAVALLPKVRSRGPGWRALVASIGCLALIGLLAAAAGLASILRPDGNPLPLQLIVVPLSIGLGLSLPGHDLAVIRARTTGLRLPVSPAFTLVMRCLFPLLIALGWGLTEFLDQQASKLLREGAGTHARAYTSIISAHMQEMDRVAQMLTDSPTFAPFFASPDASLRAQVESELDRHAGVLPSTVCYILDTAGTTVSSSNRREKDSFEGKNYAIRPYVADALAGRQGSYFAVGLTSGRRGYYASAPVQGRDGGILGVVAIKQEMDLVESTLGSDALYFLVDPDGIVFMSARREMILHPLWPLAENGEDAAVERSRQFGPISADPVLPREPLDGETSSFQGEKYHVARCPVSVPGWSLVFLAPSTLVALYRLAGILATLTVSIVVLAFSVMGKISRFSTVRIAQSQSRYRGLVETMPDWVSIVDTEGRCVFVNNTGLRALGRSEAEVPGRKIEQIHSDEMVQLIAKGMSEAYATGRAFFEIEVAGADGARRTWSFTVVPLAEGGQQGEIMLIGADVTDSRAAAERLVRSERMAAVGSLAAGVAHQFNNINTVALGYLQIVQGAEAGIPDRSRRYLAAAREAIERSVAITTRLLALTGAPGAVEQSCMVGDAARSMVETLRPEMEAEGISIALDLADTLPIAMERHRVDFILRELLSNARHAMTECSRRELGIATGQRGRSVFLRISDTGLGIGEEDRRALFTPFHSRKGEHAPPGSAQARVKGVGLSLSMADSIVKGRGGRIDVESAPGAGAAFTVWLPCAETKS